MTRYAAHVLNVPQSEPLAGQVKNSAGGHSWEVDCWSRLDRFLVLGAEGGSYYATERKLVKENAQAVLQCHAQDASRAINRIAQVSEEGRAPKNDPAIFALAMLSNDPLALSALPRVCRIPTHLFQFVEVAQQFRGWGRGLRRAVANWYDSQTGDDLAYQMTKYQNRGGWTHHDLLHKCHAKPIDDAHNACFKWAKSGYSADMVGAPALLAVVEEMKSLSTGAAGERKAAELIRQHRLAREVVPTELLNSVTVWEALLDHMPLGAMLRNLGKMSSIGLLKPLSAGCQRVVAALDNQEALKKARIHPIAVLMALSIYRQGRGLKGALTWTADSSVLDALDAAFYKAFAAVEPSGKRHLLALDVSGSMSMGQVGGSFLTPRQASAAMAMVAVKTEPLTHTTAFTSSLVPLPFGRTETLAGAIQKVSSLPFGSTDCAQPMIYALRNKLEVDAFVVYTDSETWCGGIHPSKALVKYRKEMGINAKLIVVGIVSNGFTIADPKDGGMLDVCGFDASVPQVMREFVA